MQGTVVSNGQCESEARGGSATLAVEATALGMAFSVICEHGIGGVQVGWRNADAAATSSARRLAVAAHYQTMRCDCTLALWEQESSGLPPLSEAAAPLIAMTNRPDTLTWALSKFEWCC